MTWPTAALGDLAEIESGSTPKTSVSDFWDGDVAWATPKDLSNLRSPYISSTPRTITAAGLASCGAKVLPAGSVLFSSRAPIGHVAINTVPMATNQGFKSFVPKGDRVDAKYLFHWLRTHRPYLEGLGNGATFKEVSKAVVARVEIPLPSLEGQRRIAAILDQADALRTKRREALALLDDLTQSIFIDMFMLPGSVPEQIAIGEALKFKSGAFLPAKAQRPGPFPVYGGNGVNGRHDQPLLADPVVVIGRVGAYCGAVHLTQGPSWVTDNALYVSNNPLKLSLNYLNHALRHLDLNQYSSQSGQPLVSASRIAGATIGVPSRRLQKDFDLRLLTLDMARKDCIAARTRTEELFHSLQAQAFSGRL